MESAPTGLPTIVQTFKRYSTIEYIKGAKNNIYPPFNKQIWQRGYHEHIIRNEQELQKIRQYIQNNPAKWQEDTYFT
jgi:putative transposase